MIVMGLDVATTTGIARWDTARHESSILCSTIKSPTKVKGHRVHDLQVSCSLTQQFRADLKKHGLPDYVVIEAALKRGPNADTIALLNTCVGAIAAVIAAIGCQMEVIESSEWRKAIYGFGRKRGWASKDWKAHAKASCDQLGIVAANADEAEAALLAFYGGRKSQQVKMMRAS